MGFKQFISQYNIYVDMDGVLTDFEKAFRDLTGETPEKFDAKNDLKTFWKTIDTKGGISFWSDMEWTKDGKELWKYVKKHSPTILSSPSNDISSSKEKEKWLNTNLMGVPFILAHKKEKEVKNGKQDILIDDTPNKIKAWENAGGTGILHKNTKSTLKELKDLGI